MLVEPIQGLASKSHLILIRDGKLNLVPWDALVDNSDRYLVETKNISYAPSMSSAILLREKPPIKAAKALLAVGGVTYDQSGLLLASTRGSYSPEKLGNLPGSRDEVRDAAKLIEARQGQVDLQLGADGTKDAFEQALRNKYSIIHLAVHALADSKNPDHAALFLLADKKSGTDGVLDSAEVLTLTVRANLVVLSACETAVGRLEGQEGIETLSRAFLLAGARTVVSTLWTIDDTFSRVLIAQFYTGIANGETASVALRNAKLELLKTFGPQAVPYRWAAYTLEGARPRSSPQTLSKHDDRPTKNSQYHQNANRQQARECRTWSVRRMGCRVRSFGSSTSYCITSRFSEDSSFVAGRPSSESHCFFET